MENDSLTYYGGAVKALGGGKIGGYLALFTTDADPDTSGDFFTKATDFLLEDGDVRPILYDHGLDKTLKRRQLGRASVKIDDAGVWMEGQLQLRDQYEKAIYAMVEMGKLGWSSGSASHLVSRTPKNKSHHLDSWPIVEASLTPMPVEPRTSALPLKAMAEAHIDFEALCKSVKDEAPEQPERPVSTEAYSALKEIIAPSDLKGLDETSDAVGAAVKELRAHARLVVVATKSCAVRHEDSARLRYERDGRPVSKTKREWVVTERAELGRTIDELKRLDEQLAGIQRLYETTDAQEKAASEQARHELLRTHKITGNDPLQGDTNGGNKHV